MKTILTLLFTTLLFIGCEKDCPDCPAIEEDICWECITTRSLRFYYCEGITGPATQGAQIIDNETVCDLTQSQITAKEEANTYSLTVFYDCENTTTKYSHVRYDYKMNCVELR